MTKPSKDPTAEALDGLAGEIHGAGQGLMHELHNISNALDNVGAALSCIADANHRVAAALERIADAMGRGGAA